MKIKSEAELTTFEAICMLVGNSIGTGIIAVCCMLSGWLPSPILSM